MLRDLRFTSSGEGFVSLIVPKKFVGDIASLHGSWGLNLRMEIERLR